MLARRGRAHGVVGENGSGKSALLRVLAGELAPGSGHVARRGGIGHDGTLVIVSHDRRPRRRRRGTRPAMRAAPASAAGS
ncbi:ATP-binding cassette domain-containing protein [Streptosporangium canum]|uniref:ATP-binding cassette domain-containing protein n=1 Tax=Streptosporangium canum TaxID=324952 RepID=UPI003422835A